MSFLGLFDSPSDPYKEASKQYQQYIDQAKQYQSPFYNAGVNAIDPYQQRLQQMSDPAAYYNNTMAGYSMSPYAQIQQQQAMNSAQNAASASGLSGSTPLEMQMQQNASDISTSDMDKYFQNLMGINTQYLGGLNSLIGYGANAANQITGLYGNAMGGASEAAYGGSAAQQKQKNQMMYGLMLLAGLGL